jgi:hypothetical protein
MKRFILLALMCCRFAEAADPVRTSPVRTAWIMSPAAGAPLKSLPEVHSVSEGGDSVIVRSAGISLRYFGPLQPPPIPSETPREFVFKIPIHPEPETRHHARVPIDVIGTFVNGLPIYNHFEALSFDGANLWHYDAVNYNPAPAGLLEQLVRDGSRHSPLIGFALDGYPVYGPWAYANTDGTGGLRRMHSSYRLRSIQRRHDWPDGTCLTPEQYGPDVTANDPLGTFAEDYEYAAGSGDLDEFNGRLTKTPEYPDGTYAYFLTTDAEGRLAFPYLIGPRFYGRVPKADAQRWFAIASKRLDLSASEPRIEAGHAVRFRLQARTAAGDPIRYFEYVHERPIHFLIASADLVEFDHIHPELANDDSYQVAYTFAHGGRYRIWADYSVPGEAPHVDEFDIDVIGPARLPRKLIATALTQTAGSLTVKLTPAKPLRAGDDVPIALSLTGSIGTLEPYLGAWAHVIVIGEGFRSYAHAHPIEPVAAAASMVHTHAAVAGPPPSEIHIVTNFPSAGLYKLWAQFQQAGQVITVPFVLQVEAAPSSPQKPHAAVPPNAIRIRVTQHGYEPATVAIPANAPSTLAFTRDSTPNCGSEVVFPSLGIRKELPVGETVLVSVPARLPGEIGFSCGMGMYRGMIVAR